MINADTITDEELLNLRDEIVRLTCTALGEDEGGGLRSDHPIVRNARHKLVAVAKALWNLK